MPENKRLQHKFYFYFQVPLALSILICFAVTVILIVLFINRFPNDETLQHIYYSREEEASNIAMKKVQSKIEQHIQSQLRGINSLKAYYTAFSKEKKLSFNNKEKMLSFINNHTINTVKLSNKEYFDAFVNNASFSVFNYGLWFISPEITTLSLKDPSHDPLIEALYIISNLHIIMRTLSEVKEKESEVYNMFTIFIKEYNIVYFYPFQTNFDFYKYFNHNSTLLKYPHYCINSQLSIPDYYYLQCEIYYLESYYNQIFYQLNFSLSSPYTHQNGKRYQSACSSIGVNDIAFCVHSKTDNIELNLDLENSKLRGYFLILKTYSEIPMYYPGLRKKEYGLSITDLEFGMNQSFYINEYEHSRNTFKKLSYPNTEENNGYIYKDKEKRVFNTTPVNIVINNREVNILNIIYLHGNSLYIEELTPIKTFLTHNTIFQIIFLLIMLTLVIILSSYLFDWIGERVVKQIQFIVKALQKDDEDQKIQIDQIPYEFRYLFKQLILIKKIIKSTAINYDTDKIEHFIFAKELFKKMDNTSGILFCDSNIGNIFLKEKRYEMAIVHLAKSIENEKKGKEQAVIVNRYKKILYAYRKYYKNIKHNGTKQKNSNDLYYFSPYHSLDYYEATINGYINLFFDSPNKKCEGKIELLRFLIKHRLNDTGTKNKEEIFHTIVDLIKEIRNEIQNIMNRIENEEDYIKATIDLFHINNKILENIDTSIHVLEQKLNYLIGIFCLKCEKYYKAIDYFYQSKSNIPYSLLDANIMRKSLKHINQICTLLKEDNPLLFCYSNFLEEEYRRLVSPKRSIAIFINSNDWLGTSEESQLITQSKIAAVNIHDMLITSTDYYGVFLYMGSLMNIVAMMKKRVASSENLRDLLDDSFNVNNVQLTSKDRRRKFSLDFCVKEICAVMSQKEENGEERQKWVVVICKEAYRNEEIDVYKKYNNKNNVNIAFFIVGTKKDQSFLKGMLHKGIAYAKSIEELKKLMKVPGHINSHVDFPNERYEQFDNFFKSSDDVY